MDTNDKKNFEEQDHPLKNTDRAFVQVGKHGEPVIPKEPEEQRTRQDKQDSSSTPEKR